MFDSLVKAQALLDEDRDTFLFFPTVKKTRPAVPLSSTLPVLSLRGQLGVARRGEASPQVLEDVKRQTAHQRDDGHLPQER